MTQTRKNAATVTLAVAIAVGCLVWWVLGAGAFPSLHDRAYHVNVIVPEATAVGSGARVRIAGVDIGRVRSITQVADGARVSIEVKSDHAPLAADTRFAVRTHTLVGENYIELTPGVGRLTVPSGGTLPIDQAGDYVDADQILSVLRGKTRGRARQVIRNLGDAVSGKGQQLNGLVEQTSGFIQSAAPVTALLDHRRTEVAGLVDDLGRLTATVGAREASIRSAARDARTTFASIAARDAAVRDTLDQLPPALDQARKTTRTITAVTGGTAPVLADLGRVLRDAKPAVDVLAPAATRANTLVAELGRATPGLRQTLTRLRAVAPSAATALPKIRKVLCQANPLVDYLSPYARDLGAVIPALGSVTNYYDATGHAARLLPVVNPLISGLQGYDEQTTATLNTLLSSGVIGKTFQTGYNPITSAGGINGTQEGAGATGPSTFKVKYPRVQAEC